MYFDDPLYVQARDFEEDHVVKRMYLDDPPVVERLNEPGLLVGVLVVSSIIIVILGVYPGPVLDYLSQVANYLMPAASHITP
jgi:formate hydrogenlyase subunit 3/multisubunit Na+/H+ antiporter MnhD subunit